MNPAAVLDAPTGAAPPPAGAAPSPVEYVRGLSPEDKQAVFLALLREAIAYNGDAGLLPVEDEDGKAFGYYVPPKAAQELFDRYGPKLTEEDHERTRKALASLDSTFSFDEFMEELRREDEAEGQ